MITIIKQRIIGTAILLSVLAMIALLLISHAGKEAETVIVIPEPRTIFSDSKSDDMGGVEILQFQQEAEVEPVYKDSGQQVEPVVDQQVIVDEINQNPTVEPETTIKKTEAEKISAISEPKIQTKLVPEQKVIEEPKVKIVEQVTGKGWIIQLASFSQKNNAEQLRDKAKKLGYNAKIETGKKGDQQIYRVRIGPEYERSRVDKLVVELTRALKVSPQVLLYKP